MLRIWHDPQPIRGQIKAGSEVEVANPYTTDGLLLVGQKEECCVCDCLRVACFCAEKKVKK